jgi:quercetin dioxygenase-like cupin family protein
MNRRRSTGWLLAAVVGALPGALAAEDEPAFVRVKPEEIVWERRADGVEVATIYGDPTQHGFYIIRARFPPGVMSAPHYHPNDRHVTVISGTWHTGTDASFDKDKTVALPAGSYMLHPGGAVHFDGAKDNEVIVEIKGIGPAPSIPAGQ